MLFEMDLIGLLDKAVQVLLQLVQQIVKRSDISSVSEPAHDAEPTLEWEKPILPTFLVAHLVRSFAASSSTLFFFFSSSIPPMRYH